MVKRNKKTETLSDKISGLLTTAPSTFDPEEDIYEETTAKVTEDGDTSNDEEILSKFRKANATFLEDVDKRYVGKKGSRKSLKESDEEWTTEDEGLSTDEGEALDGIEGTQEVANNTEESGSDDNEEENESESDFSEGDIYEDGAADINEETQFITMSDKSSSSLSRKGTCVRNQLNIWENLLEMRIQLQKCLIESNKMPQYDVYKKFLKNETFKAEVKKTKSSIQNLLNKFLTLQLLLLKQYPETKSLFKEKKDKKEAESDEEILSDLENEEVKSENSTDEDEEVIPKKRKKLSEFEEVIKTRHKKYSEYRNSVIQKWNDKTRLTNKTNSNANSIIQHINFILENKLKLIRRTQLKRSEYEIIGKPSKPTQSGEQTAHSSNSPEEYDPEIYDDDDFYHQLLRELIEYKSSGITDPVQMSRQWIQLQNLRSKMKRKIDTRATKGRKIRYAVHSKLVNYMAPIDYTSMTEDAKNELYASLFGKKL